MARSPFCSTKTRFVHSPGGRSPAITSRRPLRYGRLAAANLAQALREKRFKDLEASNVSAALGSDSQSSCAANAIIRSVRHPVLAVAAARNGGSTSSRNTATRLTLNKMEASPSSFRKPCGSCEITSSKRKLRQLAFPGLACISRANGHPATVTTLFGSVSSNAADKDSSSKASRTSGRGSESATALSAWQRYQGWRIFRATRSAALRSTATKSSVSLRPLTPSAMTARLQLSVSFKMLENPGLKESRCACAPSPTSPA